MCHPSRLYRNPGYATENYTVGLVHFDYSPIDRNCRPALGPKSHEIDNASAGQTVYFQSVRYSFVHNAQPTCTRAFRLNYQYFSSLSYIDSKSTSPIWTNTLEDNSFQARTWHCHSCRPTIAARLFRSLNSKLVTYYFAPVVRSDEQDSWFFQAVRHYGPVARVCELRSKCR